MVRGFAYVVHIVQFHLSSKPSRLIYKANSKTLVSMASKRGWGREFTPTTPQLLKHPLAFVALVPKEATIFAACAIAGAIAGAAAKSVTVPLDRIKLLMQRLNLQSENGKKNRTFVPLAPACMHEAYMPNLDFLKEKDNEVDLT